MDLRLRARAGQLREAQRPLLEQLGRLEADGARVREDLQKEQVGI